MKIEKEIQIVDRRYDEDMPNGFTGIRVDWEGISDYYKDGKLHRIDGPAYNFPDNRGDFYLNGMIYHSKESWFNDLTEEEQLKALFNIDEWKNTKEIS